MEKFSIDEWLETFESDERTKPEPTTMIRVKKETRAMLDKLKNKTGLPFNEMIHTALVQYEKKHKT